MKTISQDQVDRWNTASERRRWVIGTMLRSGWENGLIQPEVGLNEIGMVVLGKSSYRPKPEWIESRAAVETPGPAAEAAKGKTGQAQQSAVESEAVPKYKESKRMQAIRAKLAKRQDHINELREKLKALVAKKPLPEFKRPPGESGFVIKKD